MVSSKSNEWSTPQKLFDYLDNIFDFTLDPCCTKDTAKCSKFYTDKEDGLSQSWENEIVFMNPPYGGHTAEWLEKARIESSSNNAVVVCLIVSATDRSYWHTNISKYADEIWFFRGRVKFGGKKTTAPFASAIVIYRPTSCRNKISFVDLREFHQKL